VSCDRNPDCRTDTEIESEAANWIIRMEGEASAAERARFAWRQENERHETACRRLETVWSRAGILQRARLPDAAIDADLLKPRRVRWLPRPLVAYFAEPRPVLQRVAASLIPLTAVAAMAWIAVLPLSGTSYETAASESEQLQLEDGSAVRLHPSSRILVRMTDASRIVELEHGEVRFIVRKDPAFRPFDVRAGDIVLRAKGTIFTVRRDAGGLEMQVAEGSVAVARRSNEAQLGRDDLPAVIPTVDAGERVSVTAERIRIVPGTERRVTLRRRPLPDAIREFNLFYDQPMRIADESLDGELLSGSFRAVNRAGFLESLAEQDIRSEDRGPEILLFR